jgi:hypothetical protein
MKTIAQCTAKFSKQKFASPRHRKSIKKQFIFKWWISFSRFPRLIMEEKHAADVASRVAACGEY